MAYCKARNFGRRAIFYTALLCLLQPTQAFSQCCPWKNGTQAQPSASQPHRHHDGSSLQTSPAGPSDQRKKDDRRLDDLAVQFYHIKANDAHAIGKLRKLDNKVKHYQASLRHRQYNASDIIHDAKNLEHRISRQLKGLETKEKAASLSPSSAPDTPAPAKSAKQ